MHLLHSSSLISLIAPRGTELIGLKINLFSVSASYTFIPCQGALKFEL